MLLQILFWMAAFSFPDAFSVGILVAVFANTVLSMLTAGYTVLLNIHVWNYISGFVCQIRAVREATSEPIPLEKREKEKSNENWKIKMLYDGECPLCMREVNMLNERNASYGTIKFVDISSKDYSPVENQGLDYETVYS